LAVAQQIGRRATKKRRRTGMSKDIEVTVAEVVNHLRITGRFMPALRSVVERKVAAAAARKMGLRISASELQRSADVFRVSHDLAKAKDMKAWLRTNGIGQDAFETYIETSLLISKLKNRLLTKSAMKKYSASPVVRSSVCELVYQAWLDAAL
jgi:hypothetical protein